MLHSLFLFVSEFQKIVTVAQWLLGGLYTILYTVKLFAGIIPCRKEHLVKGFLNDLSIPWNCCALIIQN